MPDKKRQHYVPKFYLRNFSWDDRKAINIYNKRAGKLISNGDLSKQCYEPYFYGTDLNFEEAFSESEDKASKIIGDILVRNCPPTINSNEHHALLLYTLLQHSRTKYALCVYEEMDKKFFETIVEKNRKYSPSAIDELAIDELAKLNQVSNYFSNYFKPSLLVTARAIPVVMDLRYKVLKNVTSL